MSTYGLIRSWHVIVPAHLHARRPLTLCGRTVYGGVVDTLPQGKTCETCLRIAVKRADTFRAVAQPATDRVAL